MTARCIQPKQQGFSLAESLIAISILSFTLLTIIGFMPAGLDNLRKAEDRAAKARIVASLVSELEAKPWTELFQARGQHSRNIYYDRSGMVEEKKVEWAYVVRYRITDWTGVPGAVTQPLDLLTVEVEISDKPLASIPFSNTGIGAAGRTYDVKIAHLVNTESAYGRVQTSSPLIP